MADSKLMHNPIKKTEKKAITTPKANASSGSIALVTSGLFFVRSIIASISLSNHILIAALVLFFIILTWTPPHSWALALFRSTDYKACNIPMMPVVKGEYYTKKQMLIYSILMCITSLMPFFLGMATITYLVIAIILDLIFLYYSIAIFNDKKHTQSKKLFAYSIFYLFVIFCALDLCKL